MLKKNASLYFITGFVCRGGGDVLTHIQTTFEYKRMCTLFSQTGTHFLAKETKIFCILCIYCVLLYFMYNLKNELNGGGERELIFNK
jgi:hypothetical protein